MVSGKCNLVSQSYILSSQWEGLQSLSQDVLTTCQGCKSLCLIKHHARIDWHPSSCLAEMGNYPFLPMRMDRYEYDRMYLLQKHRPSQQSTPGKSFPGPSWNGSPSHLSGDHQNITSSMKETLELNRSPSSSFKHLKKSKLILIFKMLRSLLPEVCQAQMEKRK
ncbi:uncharacterized protein LOC120300205 isoform X5 [Crotalus tigris]|uniref:uncharacterized protein LOC120300205 isoform X5 n=1 Tax=Crotalus tigris TaxID=88082 RepID=UPI00192F7C9D|nr:uncharacterized protein LOC120300205 isoform X5 [Crotalus tigris]XP_039181856.1 uncharacterized protein LOC120300205 isoform X5 [Crotalus tigris]XP_039181857.1 uncharacterized protein LOC120300205 isoform X5 [Crotalus tigris]